MREGMDRDGKSGDHQQLPGQITDFPAYIIQLRDQRGAKDHGQADDNVDHFGQEDQLAVHVPRLIDLAGAEALPHHDGYGGAHGEHDHAEQVPYGAVDVQRRHGVQSAGGIELGDKGHAQGPENLVEQQRGCRAEDLRCQFSGNIQAFIGAGQEPVFAGVQVGVNRRDQQLHIPGDHCCDGGAFHAHGRGAEMAEDQYPVAEQVGQDRADTGEHRNPGFPGLPQRAGIDLHQREGRKPPQHDIQVVAATAQGQVQVAAVAFSPQEGSDEAFAENQVDQNGRGADEYAEVHFKPEGVAHAVHVALAEELSAVDACAAHAAEHGQAEHHHHLVGDGGSRDSLCAETAHHHVVQQGNEGSDELLDDDGDQQGQDAFIESLVTDKA